MSDRIRHIVRDVIGEAVKRIVLEGHDDAREGNGGSIWFHNSNACDTIENFSRNGLWLAAEWPDDAYGDVVYEFMVPDNLNIADGEYVASLIRERCTDYDQEDDGYFDMNEEGIMTRPHDYMTEGEWCWLLKERGFDGYRFNYAGEMPYLYLFDPKTARFVRKYNMSDYAWLDED